MSLNRTAHSVSDITERAHVTGASRYRPVAASSDSGRKRHSESPLEAVRILPNTNNIGEATGFLFINGKHPSTTRPRKRGSDADAVGLNPIQPKERQAIGQPIIPKPCPFDWTSYLKETNATLAPTSYFSHVPLDIRNDCLSARSGGQTPLTSSFRPNQCMEGIDPHHESLFCALKVAEVVGRRLRLRFIGYPEKYDFWTTVDSPFLFPIGWCAQNKRRLQPPKTYAERGQTQFDWGTFLAKEKLTAVPRHLFRVPWDCPPNDSPAHMFRIGHKLEAVDKRNPGIACVATVKDSIGDYVLIHFDGWNSSFDQWAHITSELLHPVGYCEDQELVLSIPAEWNSRPTGFTWKQYLKETNSKPVPKEAFERLAKLTASLPKLHAGQRLEAVDRRCPQLIRVANVISVTPPGFITIGYDGWSEKYNVRLEASSPDLFPAGYCQATGHPLQPPLRYDLDIEVNGCPGDAQSSSSATSSITGTPQCPTTGCKGYGHVKGPRYSTHQRVSGCPYSDLNLTRDLIRPHERLADAEIASPVPDSTCAMPKLEPSLSADSDSMPPDSMLSGPCLSPDSSVKSDSVPASQCVGGAVALGTQPPALTPSVTATMAPQSTHLPVLSPSRPVSNQSPGSVVLNGSGDATATGLAAHPSPTVTNEVPSTPNSLHAMPLDLSVLGSGKTANAKTATYNVAARPPKQTTVKKAEDTSGTVPVVTSTNTNPPMAAQPLEPAYNNNTVAVSNTATSGAASLIDLSGQKSVAGSKRPSASGYPKSESKPRLASIANAVNEYARQQQLFGIAGLPVKRKRGRPRKYGSLSIVHTPSSSTTPPSGPAPVSRTMPSSPTVSRSRTSMPPIPLYSNSNSNNNNNKTSTLVTIPHNAPTTAAAGGLGVSAAPTMCTPTMMPALSIYTPLTVGAPLSGLYSTGLLLPGTMVSSTDQLHQTTGSALSPVTWSHADSSSSMSCAITTTSSASGPHSDVTEPARSRSPTRTDTTVDPNNHVAPLGAGHPGLESAPTARGDERRSSDPRQFAAVSMPDPQRIQEVSLLPAGSRNRSAEPGTSAGLPAYMYLPNHNYFDPARPMELYSSTGPPAPVFGEMMMTGQRGDFDLMGRLVPQAGAALRASKAAGLTGPHAWSTDMVSNFVSTIPGCRQFATKFIDNEIDGAALLCLEQHDLMHVLGMRLGPAVKVAGAIQMLRRSLLSIPLSDLGPEYVNAVALASSCFTGSRTTHESPLLGDEVVDKTQVGFAVADQNVPNVTSTAAGQE